MKKTRDVKILYTLLINLKIHIYIFAIEIVLI